jgi:hypothetical protein
LVVEFDDQTFLVTIPLLIKSFRSSLLQQSSSFLVAMHPKGNLNENEYFIASILTNETNVLG